MVVFFSQILIKVFQAPTVGSSWKFSCNSLEQAFLTIGEKTKAVLYLESIRLMLFDDFVKIFEEPGPVVIVFGINNSEGNRKQ